MKFISGVLVYGLLFTACNKKSGVTPDHTPPAIVLLSPVSGQLFLSGQAIHISGSITDDQFISEAHVHVYNQLTGDKLMDIHLYPSGPTASFNENLAASQGITYQIQVLAADRNSNQSSTTVIVSCN